MSHNKRVNEPPAILELLLPLIGLMLVAVFFLPGFRQLLGTLLFIATGLIALSLVVGMGLYIRHLKQLARNETPAAPEIPTDAWTVELLGRLDWKRFEEITAAYYHELGYVIKHSQTGPDGSGAVHLYKNGKPQPAMVLQRRAWNAGPVGPEPLRELAAVMATDKVGYGVFFTPGDFTAEASAFARGKILDLVDGREFIHRIKQLAPAVQQSLLEEATQGDYTTPTCPGCDIKMVPASAEDQPVEGGDYWVCRNRPQCQRTLPQVKA